MRNPTRKTVADASSQTGHTGRPRSGPPRQADQTILASRYAIGGYASGTAVKMSPAVEEPERHREREQHDEVEVPHRQRLPEVGEPDQEDRAEAEPDREAVDLAPAEGAARAAGHLPGDLRPGPGLGDGPGLVVDATGRDLARRARPDADAPVAPVLVEGRVGDEVPLRIAVEPVRHLVVAEEDRGHALLVQLRRPALRSELVRERRRRPRPGRGVGGRDEHREREQQGEDDSPRHGPTGAGTTRACCRRS